jgi:hypothetical protein
MNSLEIEIGDTVSFLTHREYTRSLGVCTDICLGDGTYRISWDNYNASWDKRSDLTLIKKGKTMQFTKSDLIKLAQSNTVLIKYRDESYRVLINGVFNGVGWATMDDFSDDLKSKAIRRMDVVAVYTSNPFTPLVYQLEGQRLNRIWERTEQTEAQKEMEVLQEQAKALQEQAQAIQEQITKLQGTL